MADDRVFVPTEGQLGIVAFFSGGGSSFKAVHENSMKVFSYGKETENYGAIRAFTDTPNCYNVVAAFTDTPSCKAAHYALDNNIPLITHDIRKFYKKRGRPLKDMDVRAEFDAWTVESVDELAEKYGFQPDVVMLSGYMRLVTKPLLERWPNRIFNVHPADLTVLNDDGRRKYTGDNAVYDAIKAGEKSTRSTIHIVNELADQGPIVVQSDPLPVQGLTDEIRSDDKLLREFSAQHQERMKNECDIPAFLKAMMLVSTGRIGVRNNEVKIFD